MHQTANSVPTTQDIQPPTMQSITLLVASTYRITIQDLKGRSRRRKICRPRQVAMFLIRDYFGKEKSFPMIGRWFGHHDHTSALHAWQLIPQLMDEDVRFCGEVNSLRRQIRSDPLIVIPGSFEPTPVPIFSNITADVIEVVATYFAVDSLSFDYEPDKNDEYLYYCWQVYTHIAKLINEGGFVSEHAFKNHLMFVPDLLMQKDIREIWAQLTRL